MSSKTDKQSYNKSKSNLAASFLSRADGLREKNLYKEAAAIYLNAILLNRNDVNSYYGLGLCYKYLKNYTKAIKNLEHAAELKPDFYEAYYELGICHLLEGIPCGAIKNFVQAIQINPENPNAILQLGISHELCDEADMALMIYQKLIENSPNFIKAYEHKSTLLMKLERFREASGVLVKLVKLQPDYASAYLGIATCLDKTGCPAEAQRYYRKFLQKKPLDVQAQFAKTRLEKLKSIKKHNNYLSLV